MYIIYFHISIFPDNPIIYASEGFKKYTGYSKEEIEGRNCRFLQGKDSSPADIKRIRLAIERKEEVSLCLLNYRKDGSTFLNQVSFSFLIFFIYFYDVKNIVILLAILKT